MLTRRAWLASLVLALAAGSAAGEIYQYKDAQGRTHYTDSWYDVPEAYRGQLREISDELAESDKLRVVPGTGQREGKPGRKGTGAPGDSARSADTGLAASFGKGFKKGFALASGRDPKSPDPFAGVSPGFIVFLALLTALVVLAIGAGLLKSACNIVGERPIPLGHAMLIVFIQGLAGALASGALNLTLSIVGEPGPALAGVALGLGLATSTGVNAAVLKGMHCSTWGSAFKVTLAVFLLGLLLAAPILYFAL